MGKTGRNRKISFYSLQASANAKYEWFWKQGGRIKSWKKRLFVIHDHTLFYFSSEEDTEPKGAIVLKGASVELTNSGDTIKNGKKPPSENGQNLDYCSVVVKTPFRSYWLLNSEEKIVREWVDYLNLVIKEGQIQVMDQNTSNQTSKKMGWLIKSGGKLKNSWKQRFFVLRNDMLYYYKPKSDPNEKDSGRDPSDSNILTSTQIVNISDLDFKLQNMIAQGVVTFYNATTRFKQNQAKKKKKTKNAEDLLMEIEESSKRDRSRSVSSRISISDQRRFSLTNTFTALSGASGFIIPQEPFDNDFQKSWFPFEIQNANRTYAIYAKTQDDCDEWLMFIFESILNVMGEMAHFIKIGNSGKFGDADEDTDSTPEPSPADSSILSESRKSLPSVESFLSRESSAVSEIEDTQNMTPQPISVISETLFDELQRRKADERLISSLRKSKKRDSVTFKGSFSEKFTFISSEQALLAEMVPIRFYLYNGIYTELQTLAIDQPLEIRGSSLENCVIEMHSSKYCEPMIKINSENVRFKNVTLKLVSQLSNEQIEMQNRYNNSHQSGKNKHSPKDNRTPCVIFIENGSLLMEGCSIIYEDKTDPEVYVENEYSQGGSCCVFATNNSNCVTLDCSLNNAHYGIVTSGNASAVCFGGNIKSKLGPFLNLDETSSSRNYNVTISASKHK
ncbi:predicted protein [Naegleria gruberi]|uniref:Predicted protein n=1 Tax=Naegleria gruberi TaxID=5762 RepID=D2VLG9_NAEGR|nr:uncharacterized protein NAEGRDRAFT_69775 [Naegleria gruberi]EFC42311.1 predicted protein [Naegleria gruberi]|eukprot:XP_002675055.1 predicted protein [Naegleria gruberi strain NEG-M]